ncbi:GFA family protein [Loktanella fryxellensis]|uniref:GFA family protein n=1 Tax=Loktanella fryxellensis TaxID=245187 RepID=UPI001C435A36|nr:GFA family protein [Loktanella fryxellensis]
MQSGHVGASVDVDRTAHSVIGTPVWFASSDTMRRGFCGICDAVLFRDPLHGPRTAVAMRAFDDPTGTRLALHIFTSQQDDAYDIVDGLPQNPR